METKNIVLAWVHPIKGGDDYKVKLEYEDFTKEDIEKDVKKWLKKKSSVIEDFRIFNETEFEEYDLKQQEYYLKLAKKLKEMRKKEVAK